MPALLCIAQSYAPETTPTAIRASKLLERLAGEWDITVLTEAPQSGPAGRVRVQTVAGRRPRRLLSWLRRLRLNKLIELFVWPDESIFWLAGAIRAGRRLAAEKRPAAIVVFMMPYSTGLVGLALRRLTGAALVLNLDDSLTCTDMHPHHPTKLHYRLATALEDHYVRAADAVVYVSRHNLEAVAARAPADARERLRLVRYGADPAAFEPEPESEPERSAERPRFEIAYVGAMSGWWALIGEGPAGPAKRLFAAWTRLGRHQLTVLDQRTSSPAVIGGAVLDVLAERPEWSGQIGVTLYGNPYDRSVVDRALHSAGVQDVVTVRDPVPHAQVARIISGADLLFITLPRRTDGSPGGRISAKTYEYLMTDRPILAAVPHGENWSFLEGRPGVWLVEPDDREAMRAVILELARAALSGSPLAFDRRGLRGELSYDTRAGEFAAVIRAAIARRAGSR
jgi:hypothetical protein